MVENTGELLFFDTFAHDNTEEINLDLVQFPKPVYVTEVRIIPLGARVQADFPGGVRLGATNPSQFQIEFFVNDLFKPGASTFETLGGFEYDQNGRINLECCLEVTDRKIPTDGLVLKGMYTTITLAVYGTLTNNLTEQITQPVVNPALPQQPTGIQDVQQLQSLATQVEGEQWPQEPVVVPPIDYTAQPNQTAYQAEYPPAQPAYQQPPEYHQDYYQPRDPRSYHHTQPQPENESWENKNRQERDRNIRETIYQKEREHRDGREKRYSRSEDRESRSHREEVYERDREHERGIEYTERAEHGADWETSDRGHERLHESGRERSRRHQEGYRHSDRHHYDREERKRPKSPPMHSPKRPHTPHREESTEALSVDTSIVPSDDEEKIKKDRESHEKEIKSPDDENTQTVDEIQPLDVEEFEPILSDEDICDDGEHYDVDFDYTAYTNNDDLIKLFVPGIKDIQKYPTKPKFIISEETIEIQENLKTTIGIADDYLKSSITKYVLENFDRHNTEIKEEFIHLCEKLIPIFDRVDTFCDVVNVYMAFKTAKITEMSSEHLELWQQTRFILETIMDWLKIALSFEMANAQDQPAYKIRHIKYGVRLAEFVSSSGNFIKYLWSQNFNLHQALLDLFHQEFMALSIKLMILKSLDTYLSHKFAIEKFLMGNLENRSQENGFFDEIPISETNGYKVLIENIRKNPLVRLKFALTSILKKLNLFEILFKMHSILIKLKNIQNDISAEEINLITKSLNQILNYCQSGPFTMSQPKRFLPVASQFEIIHTENDTIMIKFFEMFHLLQCFILLLTYPSTLNLPLIKTPIFEVISILSNSIEGLKYLSDNIETINILLKCLLNNDEESEQFNMNEGLEAKSHNLGLKLAFKLQALYHIQCLKDIAPKCNFDFENFDIIDQLHALTCLTFSTPGKFSVAEVLGMNNNLKCLLQFFENSNIKSESYVQRLRMSASIGYILDLINITITVVPNVPLLEKYVKNIHNALNMSYDESTVLVIGQVKQYLAPMDGITSLAYDNIAPLVEMLELNIDNIIGSPGRITTVLRIIKYLGIQTKHSNKTPILSENPLSNYIELKYKHVILQLYSHEGVNILVKILQKICNHFQQPGVHSSFLATSQGLKLLNVMEPTIALVKSMLAYVVQCRNVLFKDLTHIPVLLQAYNWLHSVPNQSQGAHIANKSKIDIIDTLLVYTQPVSDEFKEKDSLNKTLWTQMIAEVLKYITIAPHHFTPGLLVLSELLPLPLPLQAIDDLTKEEITWSINLRKLWSAHLHPYGSLIQETINKLCISSQPQLLNLVRRICVQISDLAANSALMIAKGVLDIVYNAILPKKEAKIETCTPHIARLLNFLACLVTHNPIKCAFLHLIHSNATLGPKSEDKYSELFPVFIQILRLNHSEAPNSLIQTQECILSIIQSFCDVEITLFQNYTTGNQVSSEIYLANALPVKEHLLMFIEVMLEHLTADNLFVTYLPVVRSMLLLTEHDFGFYHLRENILKRPNLFETVLLKIKENFSKNNPECLSTLNTLVEFLRVCLTIEETDNNLLYKPRTTTLTVQEVKFLIGWENFVDNIMEHPFFVIEDSLKRDIEEDQNLENILEGLNFVLKQLQNEDAEHIKSESSQEVILPPPETLLNQFAGRLVFSSQDACDERLTDRYWLAAPTEEGDGDLEMIQCDLQEICRILPAEFNLAKEVEKLCRISRADTMEMHKVKQSDEQRHKIRRPFITPMRPRGGFNRQPQPRPDLFRSRPPNTSRPPSLHVDDFVALETCGAQPTGPTGYNKLSREVLASTRMSRGSRGRAFVTGERNMHYNRQMPWWGGGMFGRGPYMM